MKIRREVLCLARDFSPLRLCEDDRLPADIELVMGYEGLLSPEAVAASLRRGLEAFPHLTGVMHHEYIVPAHGEITWEVAESHEEDSWEVLKQRPLTKQSRLWIPQALPVGLPGSLWQTRLTLMPRAGICVIGMRVSHAVLDGAGLAWFIHQCTAATRGVKTGMVVHERPGRAAVSADPCDPPPQGYGASAHQTESVWSGDALARSQPLIVALPVAELVSALEASSVLYARLRLAALLCSWVAQCQPQTQEVALWCDARGTNDLPPHYTGNAGCFLHFPLRHEDPQHLTRLLRNVATRGGFTRISETFRRLQEAEARGAPYRWLGLEQQALQLNLVPHAVKGTDFGIGLPRYAMLLSRNSSGIRIAFTPDAAHLMIELSLPATTNHFLLENMRSMFLTAEVWCGGLDNFSDGHTT
ncbi:MAG: Transferase family [Verrucomicrobiota bacterium]|jgi:hypothetical protein